jgi:hypothetical protein
VYFFQLIPVLSGCISANICEVHHCWCDCCSLDNRCTERLRSCVSLFWDSLSWSVRRERPINQQRRICDVIQCLHSPQLYLHRIPGSRRKAWCECSLNLPTSTLILQADTAPIHRWYRHRRVQTGQLEGKGTAQPWRQRPCPVIRLQSIDLNLQHLFAAPDSSILAQ